MNSVEQNGNEATALAVFLNWVTKFGEVVERHGAASFSELFATDGYWRDVLSFTWEHRTFTGREGIREAFSMTQQRTQMRHVRIASGRAAPQYIRRSGRDVLEGYFEFETAIGKGVGFVRLLATGAAFPPVWLLLTTLHEIKGHEEQAGANRPTGDEYSQIVSPVSWGEGREKEERFEDRDPQVVIVGAGQSGLMLGARLRQMGIDALILERCERVGDNWRQRYNNLTLHNEIAANHFPYLKFPETWPQWLPKDMLASWLEAYAQFMELNVWTASELRDASFDPQTKEWSIVIDCKQGGQRKMKAKHLVIASGVSGGVPRRPKLPGLADFGGKVIHSSEFRSGVEWAGKNAIVIGTGNSGHDVAQDLYVSGASVHLMQRGATCVVSLDPSARISYSIFNEGRTVDDADLMAASIPFPVLKSTYEWVTKLTKEHDKELLRKLNAVGFKTYNGADETGFQFLYLRGAGGYYIDVGCCQLLIEKKIGLLQADDMDRFVADGLRMRDGSVLKADLVVLATGFDGMQRSVRSLLGDQIANRVSPVWGFDEDGVMRNMWRRTSQDGLWLMGGAIIEARLNSRFLALEICADLEGLLPARTEMPLVPRRSPVDDEAVQAGREVATLA